MKARSAKRGLATTILLLCVVVLPGQASADHSTFTVGNAAATEGTDANAVFTVTLPEPAPDGGTTLSVATTPGTAGSGDFAAPPGEVTIPATETTGPISVPIVNDALDEDAEQFSLAVRHGSADAVSATGTITDNDPEPSIASIGDVTVLEGNAGTVDAAITVTLSAASGKRITVPYSTAPGTATEAPPPADYKPETGNLVFEPNETSKAIVVEVNGDTLFEPIEKFSVIITAPTNASLGGDNRGEITITDDDSAPTPTVPNAAVAEGNAATTALVFQVTLPSPRPQVTFTYRTVSGTADGTDYIEVGGAPLVFPANSTTTPTTLPVTITVKGDVLDELDESFTLELVNPTTGVVVATATGTITNDDNTSKLSVNDVQADEPSSGTTPMTFTVTLAPASARPVTVGFGTMDGTAAVGSDYTATSGTLTFEPGTTTQTVTVPVLGDTINEDNETVLLNLVSEVGALVLDRQGQGTIIDKNAPPSLSISDAAASESGGAKFTVDLAGTTLRTVTVGFGTSDGTAREPGDYAARRGTLTFAPGEKTKVIEVTVVDDALSETIETFSVSLSDVVNGTITKNRGVATIEASDQVTTTSTPTTPPRPTTPATPTLLPKMVLGPAIVQITRGNLARLFLSCVRSSPVACRGSITLQTTGKPPVKLGSKVFSVQRGKKQTLAVKLSAKAIRLLRQRPTLRARVVVLVKTGAKSLRVVPGVITLKAAPRSAKPKSAKKSTAPKDTPPKVVVRP